MRDFSLEDYVDFNKAVLKEIIDQQHNDFFVYCFMFNATIKRDGARCVVN